MVLDSEIRRCSYGDGTGRGGGGGCDWGWKVYPLGWEYCEFRLGTPCFNGAGAIWTAGTGDDVAGGAGTLVETGAMSKGRGEIVEAPGGAAFRTLVSIMSLLARPLLRGRFVPGGADKLTVQYDPNPGSVTGRGCRSKSLFKDK